MPKKFLVLLLLFLAMATVGASIYKWVDEQGKTVYSDKAPHGKTAQPVYIPPQPPKEELERAQQELERQREKLRADREQESDRLRSTSEDSTQLAPFPPNATSEYLATKGTGISYDFNSGRLVAQYNISVQARPDIPVGAYLEFRFENPADQGNPFIVSRTVKVTRNIKDDVLIIRSPEVEGLKCRNYEVLVEVYESEKKTKLLGSHRQLIQSRVDTARVHSMEQMFDNLARLKQICP